MHFMAEKINDAFTNCLFIEEELAGLPPGKAPDDAVIVQTVRETFGFHKGRLEAARPLVVECLKELAHADQFAEGYSFLALCMDKNGEVWGEHFNCNELLALAFGLGLGGFLLPREMWSMLPGSMPYLWLHHEGKAPKAKSRAPS